MGSESGDDDFDHYLAGLDMDKKAAKEEDEEEEEVIPRKKKRHRFNSVEARQKAAERRAAMEDDPYYLTEPALGKKEVEEIPFEEISFEGEKGMRQKGPS